MWAYDCIETNWMWELPCYLHCEDKWLKAIHLPACLLKHSHWVPQLHIGSPTTCHQPVRKPKLINIERPLEKPKFYVKTEKYSPRLLQPSAATASVTLWLQLHETLCQNYTVNPFPSSRLSKPQEVIKLLSPILIHKLFYSKQRTRTEFGAKSKCSNKNQKYMTLGLRRGRCQKILEETVKKSLKSLEKSSAES